MDPAVKPAVVPPVDVVAEIDIVDARIAVGVVVVGMVVEESPKVAFDASRLKSCYAIRRDRKREPTGPDVRVALRKLNSIELFDKPCASSDERTGLISNQHCSPSKSV